ncbi:aminopeptidase P family protein [Bacteroidales bacterium OttesenSCG-928-A17]|nr:aminopeptidase P family protein [Bacteroidales bacterium OttesenSCG-928-A17]
METKSRRIQLLRESMRAENVQACIIPTTDPHISEYTPEHWKIRSWLSHFTGSAGTLLVTESEAGLWTDSRYFLQAEKELEGTGIDLYKAGLPNTPEMKTWLSEKLPENSCVAFDGEVFAASEARSLIDFLQKKKIRTRTDFSPYDSIWKDRPGIPANPAFILPESFSGKSVREKIEEVLSKLRKEGAYLTVLASLDSIAWLFNLRGNDVAFNPVFLAFAVISEKETVLFIDPKKRTEELVSYLREQGVVLADYTKLYTYLSKIAANTNVLITPSKINYTIYSSFPAGCILKEIDVHPVDALKAVKNETEILGFRNAMRKDGVALVKFLIWLEERLESEQSFRELDVSNMLRHYRKEQDFFFGESFETISAYGPHGAIVHYGATEETNAEIRPEGILLLDSGGQYFDGTTDITRSISCGNVSEEMKIDYTNVLKGHIQLAKIHFPAGTIGMQLDVLARQFLWQNNDNFLHGTGHGIGHFLNVHEGPQSIRMNYNPVALEPGMVTSNEPGIYRAGKYGIRIENLILTVKAGDTESGAFYCFETLTLCPIDTKLIVKERLSEDEVNWLNTYHQKVYDELSPLLNEEERQWLKQKCESIF